MSSRPQNFNNLSSEQLLLINILNDMYNENTRQINNYHDSITGLNEANNNIRATLIQMLNVNGPRRAAATPASSYFREFTLPLNTLTNRNNNNYSLENFFSPVEVYPTQSQIEVATRRVRYCDIVSPINRSCPISLENFEDSELVSVIRQCNHIFKTEELHTRFRSNCRCPVCRYDIRNYNTNTTTSSYFQEQDSSGNTVIERRNTETLNERIISNVLQSFLNEPSGQVSPRNNLTDASGNIAETLGLFRLLFNNNNNNNNY